MDQRISHTEDMCNFVDLTLTLIVYTSTTIFSRYTFLLGISFAVQFA